MSRGSRTEHAGRRLDLFGGFDERGAGLGWHVARLALVEELHADRFFERGDAPGCRALTDFERSRRLERGARRATARKYLRSFQSNIPHSAFLLNARASLVFVAKSKGG